MKNNYTIFGKTATVQIIRRNYKKTFFKVDLKDLPLVSSYRRWRVLCGRWNGQYVVCDGALQSEPFYVHGRKISREILFLHRLLMKAPKKKSCYFLDGDHFNCRRSNLKLGSQAESTRNAGPLRSESRELYISISNRRDKKYRFIKPFRDGKQVSFGYYTLQEAVEKRKEVMGF